MPTVPSNVIALNAPQAQRPVPDTFLAMAAADLHEAGRLFEPFAKPKAPDIYESRPTASGGGRSAIEINNPELGPTDVELHDREKDFEKQRRNR